MEKFNTGILIVILILGTVILFKIFSFDSHLKEAKQQLDIVKKELESADELTQRSKEEVSELKKEIDRFETQNSLLQTSIDSITLAKKLKNPKDWEERQRLKIEIEGLGSKLSYLRKLNEQFE